MTILVHSFHLAQILFALFCCIKYPSWVTKGYLNDTYPRVGAFIASFGGFIAGLIWYILEVRALM